MPEETMTNVIEETTDEVIETGSKLGTGVGAAVVGLAAVGAIFIGKRAFNAVKSTAGKFIEKVPEKSESVIESVEIEHEKEAETK